jgi:hypothetical protein
LAEVGDDKNTGLLLPAPIASLAGWLGMGQLDREKETLILQAQSFDEDSA